MKISRKFIVNAVTFALAIAVASIAEAATQPASIKAFTVPTGPNITLNVKKSSWRDPAFGDMGWTHSSDWGKFTTKMANKMVTIKLVSKVAGLHPAVTVWYRGKDDTAPDTYMVDHFYPQNANVYEKGAKDETTNKAIGDISMKVAAYGYDGDGHKDYGLDEDGKKILTPPIGMNAVKDGKPGTLSLTFKAAKAGNYVFVVGGFNSAATVDAAVKHGVVTTVSVKH
jgi:hypothetical protein